MDRKAAPIALDVPCEAFIDGAFVPARSGRTFTASTRPPASRWLISPRAMPRTSMSP